MMQLSHASKKFGRIGELMKLRHTILFLGLTVVLCATSAAAHRATAASTVGAAPDVVVEEFYKWYIHSVSHQIDPLKAGKTTLQKYVTQRFVRKLERIAREMASGGYDGDYFLEAQKDYPDSPNLEAEWINSMSTSKLVVKGATATVTISFGDNGALAKERVSLIREGGAWKIDDVKSGYAQPK
jgi:Protein of unknown function (DUF3828)